MPETTEPAPETQEEGVQPSPAASPAPGPSSLEIIESLIRTVTEHFDRALDRMAEDRRLLVDETVSATRSLREYIQRVEDRMDRDRAFVSDQAAAAARAVERLEGGLDELSAQIRGMRGAKPEAEPVEEMPWPVKEVEPVFAPGGEGLTLVISSVPGFQGLMEAQRALTHLAEVEGASVERYFDGEARIVITLREPITAARLLETLRSATGQYAEIEESQPEAMRLRVRFGPPTE